MLALRDAVPRRMPLAWCEFATLRQRLLKIGARVIEKAARVRIHFASACPDAALFRLLTGPARHFGTHDRRGAVPRQSETPSTRNLDIENLRHQHRKGAERETLRARNQPINVASRE